MTDKNKERCIIHACRMMEPCIDQFFFLICFALDISRPLAGVGLPPGPGSETVPCALPCPCRESKSKKKRVRGRGRRS